MSPLHWFWCNTGRHYISRDDEMKLYTTGKGFYTKCIRCGHECRVRISNYSRDRYVVE